MSGRAVVIAVGLVSLAGVAACALVAGIQQPTDRPADAAAAEAEADVSPGADARPADGAPPADAAPPGDSAGDGLEESSHPDGCAGGPEICTDGVDNDCNGFTDCADPACTALGYACVPPVPSGWTYDAVDSTDAAAACPAGYDSQTLVVSAAGVSALCECSCEVGTPPDCLTGTIIASVGASTCTGGAGVGFVQSDGQCMNQPPTTTIPSFFGAPPLDAGGTCGANPTKSVPPRSETDWRACSGPLGAGCSGGKVCAFAGPAFTACVVGAADAGCPSGYPTQSTPGTGVTDTRDCSANCACAAVPSGVTCEGATMAFFNDTTCTANPIATLAVDGGCQGTSGATYSAFRYSATAAGSATCGNPTQSPTPTGGVTVTGEVTACCAP